jgi:hypothetical protein
LSGKRHENLEYEILRMIKEKGQEGILQSQLWKLIKATSREGSRISMRLERAGLVERQRILHEGKWTYKLVAKKKAITVDTLIELPCGFCYLQEKCGAGNPLSPCTCPRLNQWVEREAGRKQDG